MKTKFFRTFMFASILLSASAFNDVAVAGAFYDGAFDDYYDGRQRDYIVNKPIGVINILHNNNVDVSRGLCRACEDGDSLGYKVAENCPLNMMFKFFELLQKYCAEQISVVLCATSARGKGTAYVLAEKDWEKFIDFLKECFNKDMLTAEQVKDIVCTTNEQGESTAYFLAYNHPEEFWSLLEDLGYENEDNVPQIKEILSMTNSDVVKCFHGDRYQILVDVNQNNRSRIGVATKLVEFNHGNNMYDLLKAVRENNNRGILLETQLWGDNKYRTLNDWYRNQ